MKNNLVGNKILVLAAALTFAAPFASEASSQRVVDPFFGVPHYHLNASFSANDINYKALPVSTSMPVGDISYEYLRKLDGMGYIRSMMPGTMPYSRLYMAGLTAEARHAVRMRAAMRINKPGFRAPAFVYTMLSHLEREFSDELKQLEKAENGELTERSSFKLHSAGLSYTYADMKDAEGYSYSNIPARMKYQSFSENKGGINPLDGSNIFAKGYVSGNLSSELAASASVNANWRNGEGFSGKPQEVYAATRVGIFNIDAGKQAALWGQGEDGTFLFSNNVEARTQLKVSTPIMPQHKGILSFLGKTKSTVSLSRLESGRTDDGVYDFEHPYLIGMRTDCIYDNFTFGVARGSMLAGKGNALKKGDIGDWLVGKNAYENDKWDDIAGGDFRYRFPGVQIYGELYGEDQANYLPSDVAWRVGAYLPRVDRDGIWDLTAEYAHTNRSWYSHGTYQAGWTYHNRIMGDYMGQKAEKLYVSLHGFITSDSAIRLSARRWKADEKNTARPVITGLSLSYDKLLDGSRYTLEGGVNHLENTYNGTDGKNDSYVKFMWEKYY